jgi:hypothetical protein
MIYIFSLLGYGDCLITLSLLEQQPLMAKAKCVVVGTQVTVRVAALMRDPPSSILSILPDMASFYALKKQGPFRAFADAVAVRKWGRQTLTSDDMLLFEKNDWRSGWLTPRKVAAVYKVPRRENVYVDRAQVLQNFCGPLILSPCETSSSRLKRLLLNPSSRQRSKILGAPIINAILAAAQDASVEVCLIDVDGTFKAWCDQVATYCSAPKLKDSAALLDAADCYIGPDSFFMHLAYYRKVPFFGFFQRGNVYFAPPGMLDAGNYAYFDEAQDISKLQIKLSKFLEPAGAQNGSYHGTNWRPYE